MYVKMTKREKKSGTVRHLHLHLHLAHNEWDPLTPAKGRAVAKVLFTFGREDQNASEPTSSCAGSPSC